MNRLSKEVSYLLRHSLLPQGDPHGWVSVPVLQQHLRHPASFEEIKHMVDTNDKKRFVLDEESNPPRIRAVQGHSVQLEEPLLELVKDPDAFPCVVHATSADNFRQIEESGVLKKMSRTHVHFAATSRHMRRNAWASVLLQLDLRRAMQDGIMFYVAQNGVLLSEGPIPFHYLTRVDQNNLPLEW